MSVFGVILVRMFPHLDWIRRDTSYLSLFKSKCGEMLTRKISNMDTFHAVNDPSQMLDSVLNSLLEQRQSYDILDIPQVTYMYFRSWRLRPCLLWDNFYRSNSIRVFRIFSLKFLIIYIFESFRWIYQGLPFQNTPQKNC